MGRTKSKRVKLAVKYHRIKKIKQAKKKMAKFARLNPELVRNMKKRREASSCPNLYPHKEEVIKQTKEEKLKEKMMKEIRRERKLKLKEERLTKAANLKEQQKIEYAMLSTPQGKALLGVKEMLNIFQVSNIIFYVLDPRDPINSRNANIERYIAHVKTTQPQLNVEFYYILNKVDLVPVNILNEYCFYFNSVLRIPLLLTASLSEKSLKQYRTGITYNQEVVSTTPFDDLSKYTKNQVEQVLAQYTATYSTDNVTISVIGYNNVGKSSLINTVLYTINGATVKNDFCDVSAAQNTTRIAKYVKVTPKLTMIDTPALQLDIDYTQFIDSNATLESIPLIPEYTAEGRESYKLYELLYLSAYINSTYKNNIIKYSNNMMAQLIEVAPGSEKSVKPVLSSKYLMQLYNIPQYVTYVQFITYFAHIYGFLSVKKVDNNDINNRQSKLTFVNYTDASFALLQLLINTISTTTQAFSNKSNNSQYTNKNIFFYNTQIGTQVIEFKKTQITNTLTSTTKRKGKAVAAPAAKQQKYEYSTEELLSQELAIAVASVDEVKKFHNDIMLEKLSNIVTSHTSNTTSSTNSLRKNNSQYYFVTMDNSCPIDTSMELSLNYPVKLPQQQQQKESEKKTNSLTKSIQMVDEDPFDDEDEDEDMYDIGEGEDIFDFMGEGEYMDSDFDEDYDEDMLDDSDDEEYMRMLQAQQQAALEKAKKSQGKAAGPASKVAVKAEPAPVKAVPKSSAKTSAPVKATSKSAPKNTMKKNHAQEPAHDDYDWDMLG